MRTVFLIDHLVGKQLANALYMEKRRISDLSLFQYTKRIYHLTVAQFC